MTVFGAVLLPLAKVGPATRYMPRRNTEGVIKISFFLSCDSYLFPLHVCHIFLALKVAIFVVTMLVLNSFSNLCFL